MAANRWGRELSEKESANVAINGKENKVKNAKISYGNIPIICDSSFEIKDFNSVITPTFK